MWKLFDILSGKVFISFNIIVLSKYIAMIHVNSSPPSAAYMRQQIRSALVQIMACCLIGTKPLSEPMLEYCSLDPKEQTSMKF